MNRDAYTSFAEKVQTQMQTLDIVNERKEEIYESWNEHFTKN